MSIFATATAQTPAARTEAATAAADAARLIDKVDLPIETFTLANGLRVIVLPDRTAPQVHVAIWYDVGAKHEPAGRSGFAHLFEHLMSNGSENVPGDFFVPLREAGVTDINGATGADHTMYYATVPTGSLDRLLFMESDRMGHLLGAVTQGVLDEQRGAVQNEKREGDDAALSILDDRTRAALYPPGHPYGHPVIGSMPDLNAASLDDVRRWFRDHYGPNNATLLLAGDIDLATARAKVTRYFGAIPRGPETARPDVPVPRLAAPVEDTLFAPTTEVTVVRTWPIPGQADADVAALDAVRGLMNEVDGAPLTDNLVRRRRLFDSIEVGIVDRAQAGEFTIKGVVRDGVKPATAVAALDAAIRRFPAAPVDAAALDRWKASAIIPAIRSFQDVAGSAETIMEAATVRGSPGAYKDELRAWAALTPARVQDAARHWLGRPGYRAVVMPGKRTTPAGDGPVEAPAEAAAPAPAPAASAPTPASARGPLPPISDVGTGAFPQIERATLANGVSVVYARKFGIPFTELSLTFPVGTMDESEARPGAIAWMFGLLDKGAGGHDRHWFKRRAELTGIEIGAAAAPLESGFTISTPTPELRQSLETMMLMLTRPDFPAAAIEEQRRTALAAIRSRATDPMTLVDTAFMRALAPGSQAARAEATDDPARVRGVTRADVVQAFRRWVRPELATLHLVSDRPLAELLPMLDATLGQWRTAGAPGTPPVRTRDGEAGKPRIILIDMPDAVQARVRGGQLVDIPYADDALALQTANQVLGGDFLSRINMNLREDKHWSYGASGSLSIDPFQSSYSVETQIQPDKVGAGIAEIRREVADILSSKPITAAELNGSVRNLVRQQALRFRTRDDILAGLSTLGEHGWPDDYHNRYDERLKALTQKQADAALRAQIDPARWVWVVLGNAREIRPQLDRLGLPVETVTAAQVAGPR